MFKKHWDRKTGRGRLNITKRSATAIVKKAGPQDKRAFADTDRSVAVYAPRTWISSGAANATGIARVTLFGSADWEDNAGAGKERVKVTSLEHRCIFMANGVSPNDWARRHIMWWLVKGDNDKLTDMINTVTTPWDTANTLDYMTEYGAVHTLRRGRFMLDQVTNASTTSHAMWNSHKDMVILRRKKPFWLRENESVTFFYMWWTTLVTGLAAGLGSVIGSNDTLIRHSRY